MKKLFVAAALSALVLCPAAAQAQFSIGAQGLYADDANFGAGGRLSYDMRPKLKNRMRLNPKNLHRKNLNQLLMFLKLGIWLK